MPASVTGQTDESKTILTSEQFDLFLEILERPMPDACRELLEREAIWVDGGDRDTGRASCAS